jgi:hypothetical protein
VLYSASLEIVPPVVGVLSLLVEGHMGGELFEAGSGEALLIATSVLSDDRLVTSAEGRLIISVVAGVASAEVDTDRAELPLLNGQAFPSFLSLIGETGSPSCSAEPALILCRIWSVSGRSSGFVASKMPRKRYSLSGKSRRSRLSVVRPAQAQISARRASMSSLSLESTSAVV